MENFGNLGHEVAIVNNCSVGKKLGYFWMVDKEFWMSFGSKISMNCVFAVLFSSFISALTCKVYCPVVSGGFSSFI